MKKVLSVIFFLMNEFSTAYEEFPIASFYADLKINYGKISSACEIISFYQIESFFDYSCDENSILYASPLDTTVSVGVMFADGFFWLDRFTQYCEGNLGDGWTTAGKKGTLPFSEILAVEFMRWQELGIIDISKDSAKIFITNMIDSMKKQSSCEDIDLADGSGSVFNLHGCCSLVESPSAIFPRSNASRNFKATKVPGNRFRIAGVPDGSEYRLFDLNGKLLKRDVYTGAAIESPMLPAILDVGGKAVLLE